MTGWKLGGPPLPKTYSDVVEVTDGNLVQNARLRKILDGDASKSSAAWIDDIGRDLEWQPTHWRPLPPAMRKAVYEID